MQSSKTADIVIVKLHLYIDSICNYCLKAIMQIEFKRIKVLNLESSVLRLVHTIQFWS